jgi:hypothetical protein
MKNIFLLPTEKPSRLHLGNSGLVLCDLVFNPTTINSQNIYITSDEEIKEGDWLFSSKTNNIFKADSIEYLESHNMIEDFDKSFYINSKYSKKIILTTDQDLIKDGVQSIDDEFLEWFVKNPSCEWVETKLIEQIPNGITFGMFGNDEPPTELIYKIIIPQEEPKKEVTGVDDNRLKPNYCYAKEQGHGEIGCVFPACHCGLPIKQEEPKREFCDNCVNDVCCCIIRTQETLEEAANIDSKNHYKDQSDYWAIGFDSFKRGAKWQAEKMYSEEEVLDIIANCDGSVMQAKKWFEQFKKK